MEDRISVGPREQKRALALNQVLAGEWTEGEAAEALGLSGRQLRRLVVAYRKEGIRALVHGNHGRPPVHTVAEDTRSRVLDLARTTYAGCNDQHLSELLDEREELHLSRSAVRRILRGAGMPSPRTRRPPQHRSRRERSPQEGMLLQIDGSRHDWLEGRGPYLTLIGGIDDATGKVPWALFREQEDAHGYFLLLEHIVTTQGCPLAVYRDRHGIFERARTEKMTLAEQLAGRPDPTQFGRLLEELDITSIPARSPQAKGRVERLWGTWQDRLVTELRLAGAATLAEANQVLWDYLPRFDARFAVPAAVEGPAYRALPADFVPARVFCFKYQRRVAADNTVRLGEHCLQLLPSPERSSYAKAQVEIDERLDGSLAVYYQDRLVASKPAPPDAPTLRARDGRLPTPKPLSWQEVNQRSRAAARELELPRVSRRPVLHARQQNGQPAPENRLPALPSHPSLPHRAPTQLPTSEHNGGQNH